MAQLTGLRRREPDQAWLAPKLPSIRADAATDWTMPV
jgi:hypothetical protein